MHSETCMRPHTFLTYLDQIAQYQGVFISLTSPFNPHPSPLTPHPSPLTPHPHPSHSLHQILTCISSIKSSSSIVSLIFLQEGYIYIKSQQDKNNFLSKTNWYVQKGGRGEGEGRERGRRGEGGEGEKNGGEGVR